MFKKRITITIIKKKCNFLRGHVSGRDFFLSRRRRDIMTQSLSRLRSVAGACVQLNSERELSGRKKDNKKTTKLDVQMNSTRLSQATVFHNLCRDQHEFSAPPLVCARSGSLHTICSDVTQRKGFHHCISDSRLTILGRAFTQTG